MIEFEGLVSYLCKAGETAVIDGITFTAVVDCTIIGKKGGQPVLQQIDGPGLNRGELVVEVDPKQTTEEMLLSQYTQINMSDLIGKKITRYTDSWPGFVLICDDWSYVKMEVVDNYGSPALESMELDIHDLRELKLIGEVSQKKIDDEQFVTMNLNNTLSGENKLRAAIRALGEDRVAEIMSLRTKNRA